MMHARYHWRRRGRFAGPSCLCFLLSWVLLPGNGAAIARGEEAANEPLLSLERIFGEREFETEAWGPARWLADGTGYTTLEDCEQFDGSKQVVRYDPKSGARDVLVSAAQLIPPDQETPLVVEDYAWSDNGRRVLIFTNAKRVWRMNTRGDYWVFDRQTRELEQLGGDAEPSSLMFATFSPIGRHVAYVQHNNLYVQDLDSLQITALTKDGSETRINGTSDWVNEEEFYLRKAFRWSPNAEYLAYWQFDTTGVNDFHLVNNTENLYPKITSFKYPKVGQTNSACRIGVVSVQGGPTVWFQATGDPRNNYFPQMEWAQNSRFVVFQQLNRLQNVNRVTRGDVTSGRVKVLHTDRDNAWVEVNRKWHWLADGKSFLWLSEQDGWRHLYRVSRTGRKVELLTSGAYDVIELAGVDERRGWVYVIASPDNATQRYLYRVSLDGRDKFKRVTPHDQAGTHGYRMSQDCRWAIHTFSKFGQPPLTELVGLPGHRRIRVLADNSELRGKLDRLQDCPHEFFHVDIGDGVVLDAWCIKPPDLDPKTPRRYPLVMQVYGEPAGQTVLDRWSGDNYLWHRLLAQQGYLVVSVDNRGTSAPRGRDWRKCIYRQIGILASADQAAATRKILEQRPYIDSERVGIWGWSGGGSMSLNAIFRYPDLYCTAMAIAFISDQRLYDTIYQERYMGLPEDNSSGFEKGSPVTYAHQLKGNLLLVYGTGDDNCHYQNCEVLVDELVKHNKHFSLMAYPNRSHSLREGENTRPHLYETLTRYLHDHLPVD